jgi:hypothetical protein
MNLKVSAVDGAEDAAVCHKGRIEVLNYRFRAFAASCIKYGHQQRAGRVLDSRGTAVRGWLMPVDAGDSRVPDKGVADSAWLKNNWSFVAHGLSLFSKKLIYRDWLGHAVSGRSWLCFRLGAAGQLFGLRWLERASFLVACWMRTGSRW